MNPNTEIYYQTASNGMYLADGVGAHAVKGYGIAIREDTVISAWTANINGVTVNMVTAFGITGKTLYVTDPALIIPDGGKSISITLTSGSVWILL